MLNARLYRTSWLVAGVALIVALLALEQRPSVPEPAVPPAIDGNLALASSTRLTGLAPGRSPGSPTAVSAAEWVRREFLGLPQGAQRVGVQKFWARHGAEQIPMTNVYVAVPGASDGVELPGILVVAPRDTPAGLRAGTSGTALLVELARQSATTSHRRPVLFVSTDGSTVGNAGIRWFLSRFSQFPIVAAVVIDNPGDATGARIDVWADGRGDRSAHGLAAMARTAITRAGGEPSPTPSLARQLIRLGVPQSFGDQAPIIAAGIPAVSLAARPDGPPRATTPGDAERMKLVGNAAAGLIGSLDEATEVPPADASLALAGKSLRPPITLIILLLVCLPVLVAAVDALGRVRRAGVRLGPGTRALMWRTVPMCGAALVLHLLSLVGFLPGSAAGAPALPADVPFTPRGGLAVGLAVVAGVATWWFVRPRVRRIAASPAAEAAAGLVVLAVLLLLTWWLRPFVLVLALPAAHAALVATVVPRRAHVAGLAAIAALPLVGLVASVGGQIDRGPVQATWYLLATAASGARGVGGLALGVAICACVWSLVALVALRASKGLVGGGTLATGPVRPRVSGTTVAPRLPSTRRARPPRGYR